LRPCEPPFISSGLFAALILGWTIGEPGGQGLEDLPDALPVSRVQVTPLPNFVSSFTLDRWELTAVRHDPRAMRPFGPTAFGLVAVRMAKSIGVRDGGGRILDSENRRNDAEIFRKAAAWCDYSGRLTNGADGLAGVTWMNHLGNPRHPF
jgi:hypothetical protein